MLGILAWFVRFLSLALSRPSGWRWRERCCMASGSLASRSGVQVYIDSRCGAHLRASAQALLLVCMSGLGRFLGNVMAGEIVGRTAPGDVLVFLIPCVIDGALLLYFLRGFRAPVSSVAWAGAANAERSSPASTGRGSVARVGQLVTESADG